MSLYPKNISFKSSSTKKKLQFPCKNTDSNSVRHNKRTLAEMRAMSPTVPLGLILPVLPPTLRCDIRGRVSRLNGYLKGMAPQDLSPFKEPSIPSLCNVAFCNRQLDWRPSLSKTDPQLHNDQCLIFLILLEMPVLQKLRHCWKVIQGCK